MGTTERIDAAGQFAEPAKPEGTRRGRKRDPALDDAILDATLAVLAEQGYDGMTIDMVAAHASSARATVYRRWPTKADLVLEAVARLSRGDVAREELPDAGSLREDMTAMVLPLSDEDQQLRIQAMAALVSLPKDDERLAEAARRTGIGPWIAVVRILMQRAVDRGEFPPPADLDTLAEVIPMMCVARALQRQPITREFSLAILDGVIIPALSAFKYSRSSATSRSSYPPAPCSSNPPLRG